MRGWMLGFWLATVLPLCALAFHLWPAFRGRWKTTRPTVRFGLIAVWLIGACFLLLRVHDDAFSGLDNMTYRNLARAFVEGRGFHDNDTVLANVPEALREDFLYHRGPVGRPTRDRIFSLSDWRGTDTKPFFIPTLSLAAGGQAPVISPDRFVPLIGAFWLAFLLISAFCAGGGWSILSVSALVLTTAWPAWFLRGYYTEGVGAVLIAAVVATAALRPLRGAMAGVAGFLLGLAVSYHPTLITLAVPVGLALMLERREGKTFIATAFGMIVGVFPFWAITRWVCQPYGDWTRWSHVADALTKAPEHRAMALVLAALAALATLGLWLGFLPPFRRFVRRADARLAPMGWLLLCALPFIPILAMPNLGRGALHTGAVATWSGIGWPSATLLLFAALPLLSKKRPLRERFLLAAVLGVMPLFLFIKGVEVPVGLWSQRRFLPILLVGIAVVAPSFAGALSTFTQHHRLRAALVVVALLFTGLWNVVQWPAAYFTVNEGGSAAWTSAIERQIGKDRLVVFDYYPHSVPYTTDLNRHVLGLGEPSRNHWPEVAEWLATKVATQEVWVVSSWSPTALEDGLRLDPIFDATGTFTVVRTASFFPAQPATRTMVNFFARAVPLKPGDAASQHKALDGSPIGLRGPWGKTRNDATWSREGSGIIGPIPAKGASVEATIDAQWDSPSADWPEQTLLVTPPWGGEPLRLTASKERRALTGQLHRPAHDLDRPATGVYTFNVTRPYDPQGFGIRGYDADLGVVIQRIRLEPID